MKVKYTYCPAYKRKHSGKTKVVAANGKVCCEVCGKYINQNETKS